MAPQGLLESIRLAAQMLKTHVDEGSLIRFVTHNDADGLCSGGILALAAHRLGARFKISGEKRLDEELVGRVEGEDPDLVVFSDFGSGYLELLSQLSKPTLVLDHHMAHGDKPPNVTHVNPLDHGVDGAREISASGVAYMVARELDTGNRDLAPLALVGALGDQQDNGPMKTLTGLNKELEEEAKGNHLLETQKGLVFYGYETRPLAKAIAYTTTPYIPELSGEEGNCLAFLREVGIETMEAGRPRALRDLDEEEMTRLFSALSKHMVSSGCDPESVHQLVGTIYTLKLEEPSTPLRGGREFGSLLNACGRMGRPGVGLSIVMGDRGEALVEAEEAVAEYRRAIGAALDWAVSGEGLEEGGLVYVLRGGGQVEEAVIGVVSGILLGQGILDRGKPIVGLAQTEEGQVKVSARTVPELAERGIHLGTLIQKAAENVGGDGGGHDIAAGAYLPVGTEEEFIEAFEELLAQALNQG